MSDPRLPRALHTGPLYPNDGLPPRPGEARPGLSPFGRLAMGGVLGVRSILIYDSEVPTVQEAENDMINVRGDDLDAGQLVVTLHPPRVIPLRFEAVIHGRLDRQNLTGEQSNSQVSLDHFRWPPLEAEVEFGVGGTSTTVVVDYVNGVTLTLPASFLRVRAIVSQSKKNGGISGTSAAYHLAAHVAPGFAESHAQRTVFVGHVDNNEDSDVFDLPKLAKIAVLMGTRVDHHKRPALTVGWIRFWQDPDGHHGVGDFFASPVDRIEVPNGAMYFSVFNESGRKMKMSVVFELGL